MRTTNINYLWKLVEKLEKRVEALEAPEPVEAPKPKRTYKRKTETVTGSSDPVAADG